MPPPDLSDDPPLDPTERQLAAALGGLRPAPARTSPQQVWYQAGLEAGRRRTNAWRAATGTAALAAALLTFALIPPRVGPPTVVDRIVYVERAPARPVEVVATPSPADRAPHLESSIRYVRLRDELAQRGLDALPQSIRGGGGRDLRPGPAGWPPAPAGDALRTAPWDSPNEKG